MYSELMNKARSRRLAALESIESRRALSGADRSSARHAGMAVQFQSRRSAKLPTLVL